MSNRENEIREFRYNCLLAFLYAIEDQCLYCDDDVIKEHLWAILDRIIEQCPDLHLLDFGN